MEISQILSDLRREMAVGNVSPATEAHIRNEFRAARVRSQPEACAAVLDKEATQLEREAWALRALRAKHFG